MKMTERAVEAAAGAILFVIAVTILAVMVMRIGRLCDAAVQRRSPAAAVEVVN